MMLDNEREIHVGSGRWSKAHSPCIDDVAADVADQFGRRCGLVLFTGMGADGADGAVAVDQAGGFVWAQDEESCVISSLPDAARRRGVVEFSGSPRQLAHRLVDWARRSGPPELGSA